MQSCQRREKRTGEAVEDGGEQVEGGWLLTLSNSRLQLWKLVTNTTTCTFMSV